MQSTRSKLTTCQKTEHLLRFKLNSTATSDGSKQKLGNDVRHDSQLITTKVCKQISHKWNVMFESHVGTTVTQLTGQALSFDLNIFWAICLVNNHLMCYWPTIQNLISRSSSLQLSNSQFSQQKLCEVKIFQLQSKLHAIWCINKKKFAFKNSGI